MYPNIHKKIKHNVNIYSARRACKQCNRVMVRGTGHHYHNKVKIGKLKIKSKRKKK